MGGQGQTSGWNENCDVSQKLDLCIKVAQAGRGQLRRDKTWDSTLSRSFATARCTDEDRKGFSSLDGGLLQQSYCAGSCGANRCQAGSDAVRCRCQAGD